MNHESEEFVYPPTERIPVKEILHGVEIIDPYRWLEDITNPEVHEWIKPQNSFTRSVLDQLPGRSNIERRLLELFPRGVLSAPIEKEQGWFYLRRNVEEDQPKLCVRLNSHPANERVLVDPNQLDAEGLMTIDWFFPSDDGSLVACGISRGGDEWSTLHVIDVMKGEKLSEAIPRTRFCTVRWKKDNSGFYYTKYPEKGEVPPGEEFYHKHVRFHALGTSHESDLIVFKNDRHPCDFPMPYLSPDERFMLVVSSRFVAADLYHVDLQSEPFSVTPIVEDNTWMIKSLEITEDSIYVLASKDSPNYILYRTTKEQLFPHEWEPFIKPPEGAVLVDFKIIKDHVVILYQQNIAHRLALYQLDGAFLADIPIPSPGSILELRGNPHSEVVSFLYYSFFQPPQAFTYNVRTRELQPFEITPIAVDQERYEVTRTWYRSKDGTKVHMYIYHRKGLEKNGRTSTILYGYGGFGISLLPSFSPHFYYWVERGGIVAVANLRGGNELGEAWHEAGRLDKKQNVFDDFISAAEYLVAEGYCSADTLGIAGGSNGGLLVGAVMTRRPELCAAVYCAVPLLDMVRYHKFSMAKAWIPEYGDPENPEHFKWLFAYSPYHHVKEGERYPAVLFHTAEADSRVDPSHALKMTALLQHANAARQNSILLFVESEAGHGMGKPVKKRIQQHVDMIAFFAWQLGLSLDS